MKQKITSELFKELSSVGSFEEFIKNNKDYMIDKTLSQYLNDLLEEKGLKKSEVIKRSELGETYAYQIFSGLKSSPKRDKLICLAIGLDLSVEEINGLLKIAGLIPLYPKNYRDSIIIFGIKNNKGVCEINEMLFDKGEQTLN